MATVQVSALYNNVRVHLPGIPEPLLVDAVAKAVKEFFQESEVWDVEVSGLFDYTTTGHGVEAFTAGIPTDTWPVRVSSVKFANDGQSFKPVPFKTRKQLDAQIANWEVKTATAPVAWTNDPNGDTETARIVPLASTLVENAFSLRCVVAPKGGVADVAIPEHFFYDFEEEFKYGSLAKLLAIPGKDWTDAVSAARYAAFFEMGHRKAKSRAKSDFGNADRTICYGGI